MYTVHCTLYLEEMNSYPAASVLQSLQTVINYIQSNSWCFEQSFKKFKYIVKTTGLIRKLRLCNWIQENEDWA